MTKQAGNTSADREAELRKRLADDAGSFGCPADIADLFAMLDEARAQLDEDAEQDAQIEEDAVAEHEHDLEVAYWANQVRDACDVLRPGRFGRGEPGEDPPIVTMAKAVVAERDEATKRAETAERERDAARAQLAALRGALDRLLHATWAVLCEYGTAGVRTAGVPMLVRMATAADSARPVLADTEVAAREHDARARAPVEAERDTLAAALAEVMTPRGIYDAWSLNRVLRRLADAADHLLNDHSCDRHGYEGVVCARDAARDHAAAIEKLSIPADLAAQREARVRADERAKALREAADVCRACVLAKMVEED